MRHLSKKVLCSVLIAVFVLQACYIAPAALASAINPEPTPDVTSVLPMADGSSDYVTVSITDLVATDSVISFNYTATISLPPLPPDVDVWGGFTGIDMFVGLTPFPIPFVTTFKHIDLSGDQFSYSGSFSTGHVGLLPVWNLADSDAVVFASVNATATLTTNVPMLPVVTVSGAYLTMAYVVDDDPAPTWKASGSDGSKAIQDENPSNIWFVYEDPEGWTGLIEYRFKNATFSSDDFEVFNVTAGETDSAGPYNMTYSIPKTYWGRFPDTTIEFRTKAISHDMDGGREWDKNETSWTGWTPAGHIFTGVSGGVDWVKAQANLGQGWIFHLISSDDPDPLYRDVYIRDSNTVRVTIVNPNSEPIAVSNAILGFSCRLFKSDNPPNNIPIPDVPDPFPANHVFSVEIGDVGFKPDNFVDSGVLNGADVHMSVSFDYSLDSSSAPQHSSQDTLIHVVTPPEPTVEPLPFGGTREQGALVIKTGIGGATIQAQFRVTNKARIPVIADQELFFSASESEYLKNLISLPTNPYEVTVYAGTPAIVTFPLTFNPVFFENEETLLQSVALGFFDLPGWIVNILVHFNRLSKTVGEKVAMGWSAPINFLLAAYNSYLLLRVASSAQITRIYQPFKVDTTWRYQHYGGVTSFPYDVMSDFTPVLIANASNTQRLEYGGGLTLRALAVGLYIIAGVCLLNPFSAWFGFGFSMAAWGSDIASEILWELADDDVPLSENYTSIYVPEYRAVNASNFEQKTEFGAGALSLSNTCARLVGDLAAVNETQSRKAGAIAAGDYQAALLQNDALINYTRMVAEDYEDVWNDLSVMSTLIAQNSSEIVDQTESLEYSASAGITEGDIVFLQNVGLNQTEIAALNQTIVDMASVGSLSGDIPTTIAATSDAVSSLIPYINTEIVRLENVSNGLVQESIEIRVEMLHENVTTADNETTMALRELETMMLNSNSTGDWNGAISYANQLLDLAQRTAQMTNNETYLLTFGQEAQDVKQQAGEFLKITLQHIPEVAVTPGEPLTITLIVSSEGAPTGNYVFETNSSWITQNGTAILLTQYNFTTMRLQLLVEKSPFITPGYYPVNLKVYLPGTGTIVNSILIVRVDPFYEVVASVTPVTQEILDNQTAIYEVRVTNLGNVRDTLHLGLLNLANGTFTFTENGVPLMNSTLLDVPPGETRVIVLAINPTGLGISHFTILVTSAHASSSVSGALAVTDNDATGPVVTINVTGYRLNPASGIDVLFNVSAIDPESGIDVNHVYISSSGQVSTTLGPHVITLYALGNCTINVAVSNADNDWSGDEDWTTTQAGFSISLADHYALIADEFKSIEVYCEANLSRHARLVVLPRLDHAQTIFARAWARYQAGNIPCAVVQDIVSQVLTDIAGCAVDLLNQKGIVGDAEAAYLAEHLLLLRNELALFAGFMVGTETSRQMALANNAASNLAAYAEDALPSRWDTLHLERDLRELAYSLDGVILLHALHHSIGRTVAHILNELNCLRHQVAAMASRGTITASQEAVLIQNLDIIAGHIKATLDL